MNILEIADLSAGQIDDILGLARRPIAELGRPLDGQGAALIFEKPSTRTRHSTEMAVVQLGGHPVYTRGDEIGIDVRESVEDIVRILEGYHRVIAARVYDHRVLERMTTVASVPIVNLLSDRAHPLQALADALTMERAFGPLAGRRVAWVGDYNNVARSLGEITARLGGHVAYACPPGFEPSAAELERLLLLGAASAEHHWRPADAVKGADAVHADTWVSMGQEEEKAARVAGVRGVHRRRGADGPRRTRGRVHALSAGLPRTGGDGRGDRRTAEPGVRARPRPPPRRPRRLGVPAREAS